MQSLVKGGAVELGGYLNTLAGHASTCRMRCSARAVFTQRDGEALSRLEVRDHRQGSAS